MSYSSLLSFAKVRPGILASHLLVGTGISVLLRRLHRGRVSVFTFHGLRDTQALTSGLLDEAQHPPAALFDEFCWHLKRRYKVVSLDEVAFSRAALPEGSVALTFDDGYASNYRLAWPILKAHGLPATIFVTTGYLDGTLLPWFVRLETALMHTQAAELKLGDGLFPLRDKAERCACYLALCQTYKRQQQPASEAMVDQVLEMLQVPELTALLPPELQPMTWAEARAMVESKTGLQIGGHTHSHPVLGRCDEAEARAEIFTCAERMRAELGQAAAHFAYPNGLAGDFTDETISLLRAADFKTAFTMEPSHIGDSAEGFRLPRYGSPESVTMLEMAASGGLTALDAIKRKLSGLRRASTMNS